MAKKRKKSNRRKQHYKKLEKIRAESYYKQAAQTIKVLISHAAAAKQAAERKRKSIKMNEYNAEKGEENET